VEARNDTLLCVGFHYTFNDLSRLVSGTVLKKGH
jgi:hypothetical protein